MKTTLRRFAFRASRSALTAALLFATQAVAGASEAFAGFNRMIQWTEWHVLTSNEFAVVMDLAIISPLLLGAGALRSLGSANAGGTLSVLRLIFLIANGCVLTAWIWFFHQWRVFADFGPDLEALHWPGNAELPPHLQMVWSYWGVAILVGLAAILVVPALISAMLREPISEYTSGKPGEDAVS